MLAYLSGLIKERHQGETMLAIGSDATGWVGYQIRTPDHPRYETLIPGERAELFIYSHIREDAFDLYGFLSLAEKHLFMTLLGVSGVGPKMAVSLLSHCDPGTLIEMILTEDKSGLTGISGVGKKTAERIILELKEVIQKKQELGLFGKITPSPSLAHVSGAVSHSSPLFIEAYLALQGLGFKETQAKQMVEMAIRKQGESESSKIRVEDLIRFALQSS